jgi:hypothetical protein
VSIPVGESKELGAVEVRAFSAIRLYAIEHFGSAGSVRIRLTLTEGNDLFAQLDTPVLAPHSEMTQVYEVPGNKLTVFADAIGPGAGSAGIEVLIFGHTP